MRATGKVKRLIGDVRFKQQSTLLFCDSAYQFDEENKVEAYGRVHIIHQDSIHFYGDRLIYEGNTRHAKLDGNSRMTDKSMTLVAPSIDYELNTGYGYYLNGGKLTSSSNVLTSRLGYFYSKTKESYFRYDVVLNNPEYVVYTDTLRYNTGSKVASFFGPTRIISDKDKLYTRFGDYETVNQIARFGKKSFVFSGSNMMYADSIWYDRKNQNGKAFKNLELYDTTNKAIVYGDQGRMDVNKNFSLVTGNAVAKQYMEMDSMFLFADTIKSFKVDSIIGNVFNAFRNVKIIKTDMQTLCDSLAYIRRDSCIVLYKSPILWSGSNQVTADTMKLFISNGTIDSFVFIGNAYLISRETARFYNQIKGRQMQGNFENGKIRYMYVSGNGQSIYFPKEDSAYTGVNVIECSEMIFWFKENKIQRCNFINKPVANFYTLYEKNPDELKLKGFHWMSSKRPTPTLIMKRFYGKTLFFKKNFRYALIYQ